MTTPHTFAPGDRVTVVANVDPCVAFMVHHIGRSGTVAGEPFDGLIPVRFGEDECDGFFPEELAREDAPLDDAALAKLDAARALIADVMVDDPASLTDDPARADSMIRGLLAITARLTVALRVAPKVEPVAEEPDLPKIIHTIACNNSGGEHCDCADYPPEPAP